MNRVLRSLATSVMVLLLVLSSVQVGYARAQATPVGSMVLCIGQSTVTVAVDSQGQPTGPVHLCPDCVMGLVATLPLGTPAAPCDQRFTVPVFASEDARAIGVLPSDVRVRGPPSLI